MKPTVVFTNFWDANIIAKEGYFTYCFHESSEEKKFYAVWLRNYQINSISLSMPDSSKLPFLKDKKIFRLNHFCPTYNLLMSYKSDGNWDKYRTEYRKILVSKKEDISSWVDSLEDDKVYILCCWEDTSKKCNCHRKLLYDVLKATSIWKDKAIWVYRHGNGKYFKMFPNPKTNKSQAVIMDQEIAIEPTDNIGYYAEWYALSGPAPLPVYVADTKTPVGEANITSTSDSSLLAEITINKQEMDSSVKTLAQLLDSISASSYTTSSPLPFISNSVSDDDPDPEE